MPLFGSFTYAQLTNGQVRYVRDGGEQFLSPNLGFAFSVSDGSALPVTPPIDGNSNNFIVEATPVNDTPEVAPAAPAWCSKAAPSLSIPPAASISLSDVDGSGDAAPTGLDAMEKRYRR